jgi:(1->4)-alpha-D-glucan 1-alpha-D-glucosylmutase
MMPVTSTYRVQVRPDFDLDRTAELAPYLSALGVTHLYSAPLLAATPGSEHGYDVVDPTRTNPELGGRPGLERLAAALRRLRLGLVVDIVPDHLGVSRPEANPAWWSVLHDGRSSPYADWFDIDWARGKLTIPVLGSAEALDELTIAGDELHYSGHRYPIAPDTSGGSPRDVHDRQHYRLVDWRLGNSEVNYRRFVAVSDLAALRVEDEAVFHATHAEILSWVADGLVDGLRVDHPDGLRDPAQYLHRLRSAIGPRWLVVQKILAYAEALPADWPVDGTTGYDALRLVGGLFIDPDAKPSFPPREPLHQAVLAGKRAAATDLLATELTRLVRLEPGLVNARRAGAALAEIAAQLPVYRSYLARGGRPGSGRDLIRGALGHAWQRYPVEVDALTNALLDEDREIAIRFQQFTAAVMAKGVEDTAFYRWNRFIAVNEVGGAPDRFGVAPAEFHQSAATYQDTSMTTLSTHDTKRGEDVRARLAVLSELAPAWHDQAAVWSARYPLGDPDFESLLWQTAVGTWPIARERLHAYAEKAAREAATSTTWAEPNLVFEDRMHAVIDAMYDDDYLSETLADFAAEITPAGWSNSLGQKLVQLTMPGVPDVYQGSELWDNWLVDPDTRRPVDFTERADLLSDLDAGMLPPVDATGAAKLLVTSRALRLRRDRPDLFTGYAPVRASGPNAQHVVAFDRGGAITVVTRLPVRLAMAGGWTADDRLDLHDGPWRDALTGASGARDIAKLFGRYPVALLVREAS